MIPVLLRHTELISRDKSPYQQTFANLVETVARSTNLYLDLA